jgi:hypothetical protein
VGWDRNGEDMSDSGGERAGGYTPFRAKDVLPDWWAALARDVPWNRMTRDDALGEIRRVVRTLIRVLRNPGVQESHDWLLQAAYEHGAFRRAQRCDLEALGFEFDVLVLMIDRAICLADLGPQTTSNARLALEEEVRAAQKAAARGWAHVNKETDGPSP